MILLPFVRHCLSLSLNMNHYQLKRLLKQFQFEQILMKISVTVLFTFKFPYTRLPNRIPLNRENLISRYRTMTTEWQTNVRAKL